MGVIVQGNKHESLFTSLDSDGEEEVPQQMPVNSSAVSSYDQANQDQDVAPEIPSESLYYPNHGQTNGYFFLSFFFKQSCLKLLTFMVFNRPLWHSRLTCKFS